MQLWRLLFLLAAVGCFTAEAATTLILQFHNDSQYPDLNWVGESISETLRSELSAANEIILDRDSRAEAMRRLSLRTDAAFTKATLIKLGQSLDVDYLCYGSYDAKLAPGDSQLKDSSVQVTAHYIDLRKMRDGPDVSEAGKLAELSRLEEHLAWESLHYLNPRSTMSIDQFLTPQKLTRVDAEESYIRGLLSTNPEQQQKWFAQAIVLDPHFVSPAFELGKLAVARKDYRQAITWFQRISPEDPRYAEARFKMGLSAYNAGDFNSAVTYFRDVVKTFPLNEVYNNLGLAENQLNMPAALDDVHHALDGDQNDATYMFNVGVVLLKNSSFEEASKYLEAVLDRNPDDAEARSLLDRARRHEVAAAGTKSLASGRLKPNFDETAFRQLKAMIQPKGSG